MSATHPKAQHYLESGLFDGVREFTDLEARISTLGEEKDRGDAFEVFVEGFLATQPISQAKEIWASHIPPEVRSKLNFPSRDEGADGAYETNLGEYVAYADSKFKQRFLHHR